MRLLFIGDVVGVPGVDAVATMVPRLIEAWSLDLTIVNGENADAGGFGITQAVYESFLAAGVDVVTLGNHAWNKREALEFIERSPRLIRPINFTPGSPGSGVAAVQTRTGRRALVINAIGRLYMEPSEDPFSRIDQALSDHPLGRGADAIVVDFHAESAGEKQAAAVFCDGRASLVVGTHTHTPTADHRILPRGTAYMTDAGMTGDYRSVVGMRPDEPLRRFLTGRPVPRFSPASGPGTLCGVVVDTDDRTGLAHQIAPVRLGGALEPVVPRFCDPM